MKAFIVGILLAVAVVEITAGSGFYIPKAFFTIDQNGQASPLRHISDEHKEALDRFRRSPQGFSSSSSSSSSSSYSNGGPVYFAQETAVHSSGPGGLSSRFGGDEGTPSGGHYTRTSGVIDNNGKVYYSTQNGKY